MALIPGVEITDGANTYTIAPMTLRIQLESHKADVDTVMKGAAADPAAFTDAALRVILACAKRNHPDITREQLLDCIESGDFQTLLLAVMLKSGFKPGPLGQMVTANPSPVPA